MSSPATRVIQHIAAPRTEVYGALLDPVAVASWMVPEGMTSVVHQFEPKEGGAFRITLTYDSPTESGKSTPHSDTYHGHFVSLVPDESVVELLEFETGDPEMRGQMTITFTLTDADGGTDLLAVHDGLPPGLAPADNEIGWRMSLGKLADLLAPKRPAVVTHPNRASFPAGLSGPALRALDTAGIRSMDDLSSWTERDLAALHGMGPKGIRMLRDAMTVSGRGFRRP